MISHPMAYIAGAYEHPDRVIPQRSLSQVYLEIFAGVIADAGIPPEQIDGLHSSLTPGALINLADTLGLRNLRHFDGTDLGGATYVSSAGQAARAVASGRAECVLVIMAGIPRRGITMTASGWASQPYEESLGSNLVAQYALVAQRHMHEFGTSRTDLAHIKVASAYHASHNPNAFLKKRVSLEEVLDQPPIAEPLHRMDCCVTTDGGGAFLVVNEGIARSLGGPMVGVVSQADAGRTWNNGVPDLTTTEAVKTGARSFDEAGLTPRDVDYASLYDSFTITVLLALEDLGFCEKGRGGRFVREGALLAPHGVLPVNTDGGGLSNNHPDRRGGMIRMIEAVRQLRGSAHPELQVPDCEIGLVHGFGYSLGSKYTASTAVLARTA
jgi:acetyl-CoA C-acetyltransferase